MHHVSTTYPNLLGKAYRMHNAIKNLQYFADNFVDNFLSQSPIFLLFLQQTLF